MAGVTHPRSVATLDLSDGSGVVDATSWSVTRSLSGGNLPGQVRAASGLSTAEGTVVFHVPDGRTPWRAGPVLPGGAATIQAAADASLPLSPVAQMVIRSIDAASALTTERTATLEDDLGGLRGQVTIPATLAANAAYGIDAAWIIDQAARTGGFYQTAPPVPSATFAMSGCGALVPEVGTMGTTPGTGTWATSDDGRTYVQTSGTMRFQPTVLPQPGDTFYLIVTLPTDDTVKISFMEDDSWFVAFDPVNNWLTNNCGSTGPGGTTHFYLGADRRIQLQCVFGNSFSVSYRTSDGAYQVVEIGSGGVSAYVPSGLKVTGPILGIQLHTVDDPAVWAAPNASIAATGSALTAALPGDATTAWDLIQQAAEATFGGVWFDETGNLTYRAKEPLRGMVPSAGNIIALTDVVDLPWGITSDDIATGVALSYTPPDIQTSTTFTATIWEATDAYTVKAGKTITVYADIEGAADQLAPWLPLWDSTDAPITQQSRWAAATSRTGGGTQPANTALNITATLINPSRVKITITNTTSSTLYTCDGNGNPVLTVRANVFAATGESVTITSGDTTGGTPLTVDCGSYVQDPDVAQAYLDWLTVMTSAPLPTLTDIQIVPDPTIQQGDVRILRDPTLTGLVSKVLVAGVSEAAAPGSLTMTVTLVVLDVLNWDVGTYLGTTATNTQAAALVTAALTTSATNTQAAAWLEKESIA